MRLAFLPQALFSRSYLPLPPNSRTDNTSNQLMPHSSWAVLQADMLPTSPSPQTPTFSQNPEASPMPARGEGGDDYRQEALCCCSNYAADTDTSHASCALGECEWRTGPSPQLCAGYWLLLIIHPQQKVQLRSRNVLMKIRIRPWLCQKKIILYCLFCLSCQDYWKIIEFLVVVLVMKKG